jgi:excisionase family DNA binding protein
MNDRTPAHEDGAAELRQIVKPRVLLSVEAAAEQLSLSRTRVFALLKAGEIESVKVGRLRRIPTAALERYVRRLTDLQQGAA